jgi:hypothetical protein
MKIDFNNLSQQAVSFLEFPLSWRFKDTTSKRVLNGFLPLSSEGSAFVSGFLNSKCLYGDFPFQTGIFRNIELFNSDDRQPSEVRDWLFSKLIDPDDVVYLHWDSTTSAITPWKTFVEYYDDFHYHTADDLIIFDKELNWSFLFFHTGQIYFGTNLT